MTQIQIPQAPQYHPPIVQPSYNAVKIDIHNPQVNAPTNYTQIPIQPPTQMPVQDQCCTAPIYSYPQAPIYEVPKQSIYKPDEKQVSSPSAVKEIPIVPPPVVINQQSTPAVASTVPAIQNTEAPKEVQAITPVAATAPAKIASAVVEQKAAETAAPVVAPKADEKIETKKEEPAKVETKPAEATPQKVEIQAPEAKTPKVDVNEFINKLTNSDYEIQSTTMETIAEMTQNEPEKATELLDVKIFDALFGIMNSDTSKLEGPTTQQLQIRQKIMEGKAVTEAETAEANKVTPMELAERNKQYSIYTVAMMQKLYSAEIEKINNTVVPLTELPGAANIVEQVKNNPNPMVRVAALDALTYIQRPEYKKDLTTIFSVAQNDKDAGVQQIAKSCLDKLAQVPDAAPESALPKVEEKKPAEVTTEQAKPAEVKPEEAKKAA